MTPIQDADITIYKDALDFVFESQDIRNIAIFGAYSAGKSSIIKSYKQANPKKKFLHISLAYFETSDSYAIITVCRSSSSIRKAPETMILDTM